LPRLERMTAAGVRTGDQSGSSRVALPSPSFWAVKVLTTGMGETTSDFLVQRFAPELAVPAALLVLVLVLALQLRRGRYGPVPYWTTALMVSIVGTMVADVLHVGLGVPYIASTIFFAIALAVVFRTWYRVEGTLSIHSITTPRREVFYWAAVLATFALGTAAGDLTANTLGLGYFGSIWLFAAIIAIPAIGYFQFGMGSILAFWFAYVVTRPLGASVADWLGKPEGGGLGNGLVSVVFAAAIVVIVLHLARTGKDIPTDQFGDPLRRDEGSPAPATS
jgi:uncharacterized membrane-anchored protein